MPKHAYLSASASHRWLACPPSAKLCAGINDSGSPYAQQGTDAHALCEYKVEKLLGRNPEDPTENLTWFDTEMDDCTDQYAAYVAEQIEEAKTHCSDPLILIEEKLDFSKWVPEGFGTGDCVIIADDVLHIIDFKYGLGVLVDAEENPQMMCYALGALDTYEYLYSIQTIRMTIFQPRRDNISTYEISRDDLMKWAEEILKPTAALAYNGEGEYNAGDHCQFCKAKATCRKRAEHNLELAQYDFEMPPTWMKQRSLPSFPGSMIWSPGQMTSRNMHSSRHSAALSIPASKSWKANRTVNTPMRMQSHPRWKQPASILMKRSFGESQQ